MPDNHTNLTEDFMNNNRITREFQNPSLCFERARHLCPSNAKLVCRHARMFMQNRYSNFSRAMALLDQSLAMDGTKSKWFAYSSRGRARRNEYTIRRASRELLDLAKRDFECLLDLKPLSSVRTDLAEVCHLLAKSSAGHESKHLLRRALCHFYQAVDSLEGRKPNHVLHLKRARCLKDHGEFRGAVECFKTALECDDNLMYRHKVIYKELMDLMLLQRRKGRLSTKETAFWLEYAINKYGHDIDDYTKKFCKTFLAPEMFDVCMEFVQTGKYKAAMFTLPMLVEGLGHILRLARRNEDKQINISVVKSDLKAAQNSQESIMEQMFPEESSNAKFKAQLEKARNNKSKIFDFCVLYSNKDREWVCYSMVLKLEDWYKFRGFISDRDIQYVTNTTDELGHGIENSVCTIAVISPDFLEDAVLHKMLLCAFQEDDHHILLFQYKECDVPSKVSKLSHHPTICFPDWHTLNVKLDELTGVCI